MIRIKNNLPARLPSEYQEVEYLQSTGSQHIDTTICPTTDFYCKMVASFANESDYVLCGVYYYSGTKRFAFGSYNNKLLMNSISSATAVQIANDQGYHTFIIDNQTGTRSIDSQSATSTVTDCIKPFYFFKRNSWYGQNDQQIDCGGNIKLKSCEMINNGVHYNFVPCYRKSDNEPGMYDLVNNVFYANAGSGTFLMGNEVSKRDINIDPMIGDKPLLRRYVQDKLVYGEAPIKSRYVAVGDSGKSYYSTDGETWARMSGLSNYTFSGVAYGNGMFVAVSSHVSGGQYYSTDGINWAKGNLGTAVVNGIAYGNGRFVAVCNVGGAKYSTDGVNWTAMTGLSSDNFYGVTFGNDRFVCVGASGKSYYSTNGTSWTAMSGLTSSYTYYCVAYGNGRFVAVNAGGTAYYSTDGISWTSGNNLTRYNCRGIAYGNDRFVVVNAKGSTCYSTDGISWTAGNTIGDWSCYGVTYGNDRFVAVGESGKSYYSTDGINWVAMTGLASATYRAVCYGEI